MMIDQHEDSGEALEESLGNHFQRIRRSQHKTLEEAAAATRIPVSTLAALEADDYDLMPAEVFTRGFIKLYAGYLGLDPAETIKQFISQENADPDKPADRPYRRDILDGQAMAHPPSFFKGNRRALAVTLLLAVLIGFYVLGTIFKSGERQAEEVTAKNEIAQSLVKDKAPTLSETISPEVEPGLAAIPVEKEAMVPKSRVVLRKNTEPRVPSAPAETEARKPLPEPVPPRAPTPAAPKPPPEAAAAPAGNLVTPESPSPPPEKPAAVSKPQATAHDLKTSPFRPVTVQVATTAVDGREAALPELSSPAPQAATYVLEARFRESSWVQIKVDDQPLREYTSQAGVTRVWRAAQRLVLKLNNTKGVSLTMNGEPLTLEGEPGELVTLRLPRDQS